jgi:hypothetical protein
MKATCSDFGGLVLNYNFTGIKPVEIQLEITAVINITLGHTFCEYVQCGLEGFWEESYI